MTSAALPTTSAGWSPASQPLVELPAPPGGGMTMSFVGTTLTFVFVGEYDIVMKSTVAPARSARGSCS